MEYQKGHEGEYNDVVETLTSMFGNVISKDVIFAVVESCGGDLNLAAEAVMSISNDAVDPPRKEAETKPEVSEPTETQLKDNPPSISTMNQSVFLTPEPIMSYAGISRSTGAMPKQGPKPRATSIQSMVWTDQLRLIMSYHNQGSRILIIMRGAPGCGKSYQAKQIIEMLIGATYNDYKTHIYSTDDFFMVRGYYHHDKYRLSEAHEWNQNRVRQALRHGVSPVIIDNTNIEIWEMEPYVREGVRNGYIIEVLEPNTPWAKKIYQLLKKNTHNVPAATIRRMLDNYQDGITGKYLIKYYGLSYPGDKVPPVLRTTPQCIPPQTDFLQKSHTNEHSNVVEMCNEEPQENAVNDTKTSYDNQPKKDTESDASSSAEKVTPIEVKSEQEQVAEQSRYLEIEKQLEEMEKVEKEWENGEGWGDESIETVSSGHDLLLDPRPQRTSSEGSGQPSPRQNLLNTVQKSEDWRKISLFMPSWADEPSPLMDEQIEVSIKETKSTGTCMEVGDANWQNPNKILKVVTASPRDINLFYIPLKNEKMPVVRMFDKSTMTNELLITEAYRCKNEEQHFSAFRKLFKNVPRASLRDIFDKCCGDVNWAVDIVLGSLAQNPGLFAEGENISDTEEETIKLEQCNCLAAYQIVPDTEIEPATSTSDQLNIPSHSTELNLPQKKSKMTPSNSTLQLKHEIEKSIVISDDHYSQHTLMIRKWRHGENFENFPKTAAEEVLEAELEPQPSTSRDIAKDKDQQIKDEPACLSDDDISDTSSLDDVERTINIDMGYEFISQLDSLFGRRGMIYPENVVPRVNIPISLLNEINAFWMESLMTQLDDQQRESVKMLKEDEDFARQLEMKEAELAQQGKEPEIPDFKEIMDMDFAISLYQKDVAEWKSKEPTDMAAKMTRDKLYNLFPDMSPDVLSELLMAHDNNFQATVEVLLMSTGKSDILADKNGLNKFFMLKEMERQEKLLEEEKKALSEVEWPLLPKGEKADLSVVEKYRVEADKHLMRRNLNYQKAQDYIRRGMTQVANYYSDIASFHKQKFEQANSLAAASLMQVHASNNPDNATIDLHYLRVGEAKESLDLFLDSHIQKLKEGANKGVRYHTLFFITGRGLHSNGRPRVKPAVKKRLRERGLTFSERNPGLLTTKVCADDKLSYQVKVP